MRNESELVPYAPGRLDGSPLLVLAPHADDETFGCGGVLAQAARRGARVRVVVVTDGGAQGDPGTRIAEAREAARRLGIPEPEHWGLPDRSLDPADPALRERLRDLFLETSPAVVLVPSPGEIHPDHRALALATHAVLRTVVPGTPLHDAAPELRLAAYEVSALLRPNLLVDVSDVWEEVLAAAKAYASQIGVHPYVEALEGRASARRLTLPASVRRAEAYFVVDLRYLRTHSAAEWAARHAPSAELEDPGDAAGLDVVVRTADRQYLLGDALESLCHQQSPPARVIVVDDGATDAAPACARFEDRLPLSILRTGGAGRSAAARAGLEAATASHVVYLDDDDLFMPEHLLVLGRAVARGATVPYTDAVQGLWEPDGEGGLRAVARHRTFGGGFHRERLLLLNHIPLPTVALPRELALEVGGFDPAMDLYEDWDLLLRLAARTPFVHVPALTCEYRMVTGSGAITAANPPGSPGQVAAMVEIWRRHGLMDDPARLVRGVLELVAERDRQAELVRRLDERLIEARGESGGLRAEVHRLGTEVHRLGAEVDRLEQELDRALTGLARSAPAKVKRTLRRLTGREGGEEEGAG